MVHLIHKIKNGEANDKYTWSNDQLKKKDKLIVGADDKLKLELLTYFHSSSIGGHLGIEATMKRIASIVY